jgi:hypothetical protein
MVKMLGAAFAATLVAAFIASPIQNVGWSEVMVMAAEWEYFYSSDFSEKERRDFAHSCSASRWLPPRSASPSIFRSENRIAGPVLRRGV